MHITNSRLLKTVYTGLLAGMPSFTFNPINRVNLLAPLTVEKYSTYLNFKLDDKQVKYLNNYISEYNNNPDKVNNQQKLDNQDTLQLIPLKMGVFQQPAYYISINIYNCTSPIFMTNKPIVRCEINTYVKNQRGERGTMIIDYLSNSISMDPINIFKNPDNIIFDKSKNKKSRNKKSRNKKSQNNLETISIECYSKREKIDLQACFDIDNYKILKIGNKLIDYTDKIYYKNGIMDKVYYDTTLTRAKIYQPKNSRDFKFIYRDLSFNKIDSIFYFDNPLNFVGSMWDNIYN